MYKNLILPWSEFSLGRLWACWASGGDEGGDFRPRSTPLCVEGGDLRPRSTPHNTQLFDLDRKIKDRNDTYRLDI